MKQFIYIIGLICGTLANMTSIFSQQKTLSETVTDHKGKTLEAAHITIIGDTHETLSDNKGLYSLVLAVQDSLELEAHYAGYLPITKKIYWSKESDSLIVPIQFKELEEQMETVVISGTMKEMSRLKSPVPVEVYTQQYFKANPSATIFDALSNVNGVRPQLNCNVCNTGDIHINGLEGPYTMVLIDGMPIVSGLSSVYGLSGIPQALIDRVEIVKGPASTLYGSEAVGGLINIITKQPQNAPIVAADVFATSWAEISADLATKIKVHNNTQTLLGINYFNYQNAIDNNKDNFTDLTLQHRVSIFNKWNIARKSKKQLSIAGRYVYEDRWGGEMQWNKSYRGGSEVYGESIYTNRWELFGTYQLPTTENITFQWSANNHHQNSVYGSTPYIAQQNIYFGQLTWNKNIRKQELLAGATYRFTHYDDNTPATADAANITINKPSNTQLPGLFLQNSYNINKQNILLVGVRYDYNSRHGNIFTPRLNYKWNASNNKQVLRLSIGNGYRVANVFTEDHAALTGARKIVFLHDLKPERSWNGNINYIQKIHLGSSLLTLDATAFYTHFTNKIIPDYDSDANKIIYGNLDGHGVSKGISVNMDYTTPFGLHVMAGGTLMDVTNTINGIRTRQLFAERFSGTWNIGYKLPIGNIKIDYTGNVYGPMRLPLLSTTDPRPEYSPWWSIQNIQLTKNIDKNWEIYGGVKNLLNWTPNKSVPFLIARAFDPFDKQVTFDASGNAVATPDNPHALTFDPSYMYAPNQGIRGFLGFRYTIQ